MMREQIPKSMLFVLLLRDRSMQQLFEEIEDNIQAEAPHAAQFVYSDVTRRRQEGVLWLLVKKEEAIQFQNRLKRILQHDEDIFAYQEVPLSHLLEQIGRVPWNENACQSEA